MEVAEEYDRDTVFIYSDYFGSRIFMAFAPEDIDVFAVSNSGIDDTGTVWIDDQLRMPKWGNYVKYDGDCMLMEQDKKNRILCHGRGPEKMGKKLQQRGKRHVPLQGGISSFLVMGQNYMDFAYGVPEEEVCTAGITSTGIMTGQIWH